MSNTRYTVQRDIGGHNMFYSDVSLDMCPAWVDNPDAAILFSDYDVAERVLKAISINDMTGFLLSIVPVRITDEEEES